MNFNETLSESHFACVLNTKDKTKKVLVLCYGTKDKNELLTIGVNIDTKEKAYEFIGTNVKQKLLGESFLDIMKAIFPKSSKYNNNGIVNTIIKSDLTSEGFSEVISDNNDDFYDQSFKVLPEDKVIEALDINKIKHDKYTYTIRSLSNETDFEPVKPLMGRENWEGKFDVIPEEIQKQLISFPESKGMTFNSPIFKRIEEGFKQGTFRYFNIVGGTGAGKTQFLEYLAEKLELPTFEITFTKTLDLDYMFGSQQLINGDTVFTPGFITKLIPLPITLILQDVSRAEERVLSVLVGLFDNTPYFTAADGTQYKKHPQFRVLMSSNPADENTEVTEFGNANLSRFRTFVIPYPTKEEQIERLQFHLGNKFTNLPFLEELIDVQNIITKELQLHGEDFTPDYRKLKEAVENVTQGSTEDYYNEEFFKEDIKSALLASNANNSMATYEALVPVLEKRISTLYSKFTVASAGHTFEADPVMLVERVNAVNSLFNSNLDYSHYTTQNVTTNI